MPHSLTARRVVIFVFALLVAAATIGLQTLLRERHVESRPHGWYVSVRYYQGRGSAQSIFLWGPAHTDKKACISALEQARRRVVRDGIACEELTDQEAQQMSPVPTTLVNY